MTHQNISWVFHFVIFLGKQCLCCLFLPLLLNSLHTRLADNNSSTFLHPGKTCGHFPFAIHLLNSFTLPLILSPPFGNISKQFRFLRPMSVKLKRFSQSNSDLSDQCLVKLKRFACPLPVYSLVIHTHTLHYIYILSPKVNNPYSTKK